MSRRQYPRLGRIDHQYRWAKLPPHEGPRCIVCSGKAIYKVHVEFGIFRGDDEVVKACANHLKDAAALARAWSQAQAPTGVKGLDHG